MSLRPIILSPIFLSLALTLPLGFHTGTTQADGTSDDTIATAVTEMQAGEFDAARQRLTTLLETQPDHFEARMKLAGVELSAGKYSAAIEQLKQAAGLDEHSPRPFIGLALAYLHTGQGSLAFASVEEATHRDPSKKAALQPLIDRLNARAEAMHVSAHASPPEAGPAH